MILAWVPTLLWLVVITFESTAIFSGGRTLVWTLRFLQRFSDRVSWNEVFYVNAILRKTGHFTGYAILSWFAFRGWMATLAYQREQFLRRAGRRVAFRRGWHLRAAVLAVLCTLAVASLDEFHQTFVPGRTGAVRDVILDTMGGIFAQILLLLWWTQRPPRDASGKTRADLKIVDAVGD